MGGRKKEGQREGERDMDRCKWGEGEERGGGHGQGPRGLWRVGSKRNRWGGDQKSGQSVAGVRGGGQRCAGVVERRKG